MVFVTITVTTDSSVSDGNLGDPVLEGPLVRGVQEEHLLLGMPVRKTHIMTPPLTPWQEVPAPWQGLLFVRVVQGFAFRWGRARVSEVDCRVSLESVVGSFQCDVKSNGLQTTEHISEVKLENLKWRIVTLENNRRQLDVAQKEMSEALQQRTVSPSAYQEHCASIFRNLLPLSDCNRAKCPP